MSLSETRELLQILMEIDAILKGITVATQKIEHAAPAMRTNLKTFNQVERLFLRYLTLTRHMGLPDDVNDQVSKIATIAVTIKMAMMSINMMMASNPLTAAIGIAGLLGTALSFGPSMMEGY